MLKKFVPLNSNASPSKNPYEVRTFMGDNTRIPDWRIDQCPHNTNRCDMPGNSTLSKVLTIEDEIRKLHQKAKESRFQRAFKKKCDLADEFTMCVVPQRKPKELKMHAVMRERYLQTQYELNTRIHDATDVKSVNKTIIRLNSPIQIDEEGKENEEASYDSEYEGEEEEGNVEVKPRLASPDCSLDIIYVPTKKMLQIKQPKSGMFHNESEQPMLEDDLPYGTYDPRVLQDQLDAQGLEKYDIIQGKDDKDLWTWNIGIQRQENELDNAFLEAAVPKLECNNMELTVFKIPNDLDKTFRAEIVFGNEVVQPEIPKKNSFYNRPKEIACLFVAYVESFRLNPNFWTAETMDTILISADKLLKKSAYLNFKSPDTDFDIVSIITEKQAAITLKVHYTGPLKDEPNIYKALSLYFSKYNAAILCTKNIYLLIWKTCQNSFFVFDPNGRNKLCHRDIENGKCSLMITKFVEHLVYLIVNLSEADLQSEFNLYGIYLTNYGKLTEQLPSKVLTKPFRKIWAVVNSTFALIPAANNGLQQPISGNERNASMTISLLSWLYSDIERASNWRMEVIDDLVKFGQNYFKALAKKLKLKKNQHLNIIDLPEVIMMGAFKATFQKRPFLYTGHVAECNSFLESELTIALKELFAGKWEAALLQIDNSIISVWRDTEYYYILDPFRRGKSGQVLDPEDYLTKGVACLHLHTSFESLSRTLSQKALKMRRGGKLFLHGVNIGCIRPVFSLFNFKNKYTGLRLTYPKLNEEPDKPDPKSKVKKGKKGKVARTNSIQSIPDEDLIPEFDDIDIVNGVIEDVLCDILHSLDEPVPDRPQLYKQADKVLLRSDKDYLELLKYNIKHNLDSDNTYTEYETRPEQPEKVITLEEELQIPSNFKALPDGGWIVFGTSQLPVVNDEISKLGGILSSLITSVLSAKYRISTWNPELIEYALESANSFDDEYKNYENTLSSILTDKIPNISIGSTMFQLKVLKLFKSAAEKNLRQVLLEAFISFNRLLVICQRFSCIIIKRYNFLYMFIGFPCTIVGYRKFGSGPGCILRFIELDALLRRIEFGCNPQGCETTNYVVVALKVNKVPTETPERFLPWRDSDEEVAYAAEVERQQNLRKKKLEKMRQLDEQLRKENDRISAFFKEKEEVERGRRSRVTKKSKYEQNLSNSEWEEEFSEEEDFVDEEFSEEDEVQLKHKPGKKMKKELADTFKPRPILYGYRMREKDNLFKIQGTTGLSGRDVSSVEKIKPCFFASAMAVLYAILRPLNQWSAQRVDRVIESGNSIVSKVSNMITAFERIIKNVTVDEYEFDVWVKTYDPIGIRNAPVDRKLDRATQSRHYLLLQTANGTFALYRDEFYHLFDPYNSMDTVQDEEEETDTEKDEYTKRDRKNLKGIRRYGERNTASWVLFADIQSMLSYIDKRTTNTSWKEKNEYQFHVVNVLSYKKATSRMRILQLLTDLSVPMDCKISQHGEDESTICAHNETLSWLDLENCLPIWSRLNKRNSAGRYRHLAITKLKKYDVEIEQRLWSLWGNLSPWAPVFDVSSRGKQCLACNVVACCAARVYHLTDWSAYLLDSIVISGDKYHRESLANIKQHDYEFSIEDLNLDCTLENIQFVVHIEHVAYGKLYCLPTRTKMNLAEALMYFFGNYQFGVLQCQKRSLAIGRTLGHDGGYFMFDCQSRDQPLFPKGQGAAYALRTKHLQVLLYCIVITLNVPYFNVEFTIHKVEMLRMGASVEETEEEEAGAE